MSITREQASKYIAFGVDDALQIYNAKQVPDHGSIRLVGWQCGFEPMVVAVWSYLGCRIDDDEAEDLAVDALCERKWFAEGEPIPDPTFIL